MDPGAKHRTLGWGVVRQPGQHTWGCSSPAGRGAYACSNSFSSMEKCAKGVSCALAQIDWVALLEKRIHKLLNPW